MNKLVKLYLYPIFPTLRSKLWLVRADNPFAGRYYELAQCTTKEAAEAALRLLDS